MVLTHISAFSGIGGFELAMHNAVAVPVFEWVARRIVAVDSRLRGVS
jgi:site-specific DNA-cytosine methylase